MPQITIPLDDGLKIGKDTLMTVVMRDAIGGDIIEAQEESEKLVYAVSKKGELIPTLVASPTLLGINVLRRQILKFCDGGETLQGPIELEMLKKLSPRDLNLLQEKADELDGALSPEEAGEALAARGRDEGVGGAA